MEVCDGRTALSERDAEDGDNWMEAFPVERGGSFSGTYHTKRFAWISL